MSRQVSRIQAGIASLSFLLLLSSSVCAQLSLPKPKKKSADSAKKKGAEEKPRRRGTGVVPHLVCGKCGEHNYLADFSGIQPDGTYIAHCGPCAQRRIHRRSQEVAEEQRLALPNRRLDYPLPGPDGRGTNTGILVSGARYGDTAAGFILRQVAASETLEASVIEKGVESLLGLGEPGLVISRIVLHDESPAVALVAGRVLIRAGYSEDSQRVLSLLRSSTIGKSGGLLLDEMVERDPVNGSPRLLIELLEHRQRPMRRAAMRHLRGEITVELLPVVAPALKSTRTEIREFIVDQIKNLDDPAVLELLFEHLDDRSARVANRVLLALGQSRVEHLDLELLRRSFTGQWILRDNAYAILAIIEREDDQLRPILDERHAEALLAGLRTGDHLVRGTCAAALAGIGFRSSRPLETTWLDNEVTGTMVAAVSGKDYHSDFSALQPRVLRRLRLVSGADFGTDGPRWARWWVDSRLSFYAHRAYLNVPVGGEATLELHYRGTGRAAGTFSLLGGDVKAREAAERAASAEQFFLTRSECADLISLLEREGALSPKHQPGQRGSMGPGQREIEVVIGGHGKKFVFGKGRSESWFEKIDSAMTDLRSRNRWQRFPNMVRYSNARDFWEEESGWWIGEHSDVERGLRMKSLVFNSIKQMPPSRRTLALRELEESYEVYGVAESDDLMFILDLLRDEGFYAERAELLVQLAMRCVQIGDVPGGPESIDREHAKVLIDLLLARFDRNAIKVVGSIARACDAEFMAELAEGERPLLRAVAAAELSRTQTPESIALLMGMLDDEEVVVEAAAVIALGELNAEEARTELLLRARLAPPMVRAAALRAIGMLGGEYVLEALVLGVSDPNLEVKSGAARGLVSLRDPQSAPILISLMRQSRGQEIYEIAREGLIGLGDGARADLLRVVKSPAHQARRECAMLLSGMGEPAVVPALISMFDQKSQDEELAFELAVLTCYDPRQTEAPASAWVTWYDGVTHDDSLVWFLAELERRGVPVSVSASFRGNGPGTREAALFLLEVIAGDSDYLIERARRELSRMLGADLGEFPKKLEEQGLWLAALRDTILERFES